MSGGLAALQSGLKTLEQLAIFLNRKHGLKYPEKLDEVKKEITYQLARHQDDRNDAVISLLWSELRGVNKVLYSYIAKSNSAT